MAVLVDIREADASADLAALYNAIRTDTGFPQVNLIWRHLATYPGVLEWVWGVLQPAYRAGWVVSASQALSAAVPGDGSAPIWEVLPDDDADQLAAIIESYNIANPENMVALSAIVDAVSGMKFAGEDNPNAPAAMRAAQTPILPLPARDTLSAESVALIDEMSLHHGSAAIGVRPSMYFHLAIWPEVLKRAHQHLIPVLTGPDWRARVAAVIAAADTPARELADKLRSPGPMPERLDEALEVVRTFTQTTMPEMIVVGAVLSGKPKG